MPIINMNDVGIFLPESIGMTSLFLWLITIDIEPESVRWATQIPIALAVAVTLAHRVVPAAGLWFLVQLVLLNLLTAWVTPGRRFELAVEVPSNPFPPGFDRRRFPRNR